MVQKGTQMWGQFTFYDANDTVITGGGLSDYTAGTCHNLGAGTSVTCTALTGSDYDDIWVGSTDFTAPTSSVIDDITFPDAPENKGICSGDDCITDID